MFRVTGKSGSSAAASEVPPFSSVFNSLVSRIKGLFQAPRLNQEVEGGAWRLFAEVLDREESGEGRTLSEEEVNFLLKLDTLLKSPLDKTALANLGMEELNDWEIKIAIEKFLENNLYDHLLHFVAGRKVTNLERYLKQDELFQIKDQMLNALQEEEGLFSAEEKNFFERFLEMVTSSEETENGNCVRRIELDLQMITNPSFRLDEAMRAVIEDLKRNILKLIRIGKDLDLVNEKLKTAFSGLLSKERDFIFYFFAAENFKEIAAHETEEELSNAERRIELDLDMLRLPIAEMGEGIEAIIKDLKNNFLILVNESLESAGKKIKDICDTLISKGREFLLNFLV